MSEPTIWARANADAVSRAPDGVTSRSHAPRPAMTQRGDDPELLGAELIWMIRDWLGNRPRSLQRRIGPSGLGTPCARKIGHALAGTPEHDHRPPGWLPGIGIAAHAMLERVAERFNQQLPDDRFLIEQRVSVGEVNGVEITGTCDLYDRATATVIDWKIVGKSTLDSVRRKGPSQQYVTQAHLYGLGFCRQGLPVDRVGIMYLPRGEELEAARLEVFEFDEQLALAAIARADAIARAIDIVGADTIIGQLDMADDCRFCEFRFTPSSPAPNALPSSGCHGFTRRRPSVAEQLLGALDAGIDFHGAA